MTLLQFIDIAITDARAEGRLQAAKAYNKTLRAATLYIEALTGAYDQDIDIYHLLTPDFYTQFEQFLRDDYPQAIGLDTLSDVTVQKHIKNLRLLARLAISQYGYLPNLHIPTDGTPAATPEIKTFDSHTPRQFAQIVDLFAIADERLRTHSDDAAFHRLQLRTLGPLIIAILCGGLSLKELAILPASALDGDRLTLPLLPVSVTLPHVISDLIHRFGTPDATGSQPLLHITDAAANAEKKIDRLYRNVAQILESQDIDSQQVLHQSFTYWLTLSIDHGMPLSTCRHLIDAYLHRPVADPAALQTAVQHTVTQLAYRYGSIFKHWYAVKCLKISGQELSEQIARQHSYPESSLYAPQHLLIREVNGRRVKLNNPIIDKILFVRATERQAENLQRNIRTLGIFYATNDERGIRTYNIIPERDLANFRRFLGATDSTLIPLDPTVHYAGAAVRITGGPFTGCEGIIDNVKIDRDGTTEYVRCFIVRIEGISVLGTLDIDPHLIESRG